MGSGLWLRGCRGAGCEGTQGTARDLWLQQIHVHRAPSHGEGSLGVPVGLKSPPSRTAKTIWKFLTPPGGRQEVLWLGCLEASPRGCRARIGRALCQPKTLAPRPLPWLPALSQAGPAGRFYFIFFHPSLSSSAARPKQHRSASLQFLEKLWNKIISPFPKALEDSGRAAACQRRRGWRSDRASSRGTEQGGPGGQLHAHPAPVSQLLPDPRGRWRRDNLIKLN